VTSWVSWLVVGLIVAILLYAILSIYLKKQSGLYIAAGLHIMLGIMLLPSIGLYVLGLSFLEIIAGIVLAVSQRRK